MSSRRTRVWKTGEWLYAAQGVICPICGCHDVGEVFNNYYQCTVWGISWEGDWAAVAKRHAQHLLELVSKYGKDEVKCHE